MLLPSRSRIDNKYSLPPVGAVLHLTIRLWAWDFSKVIVDDAEGKIESE